MTDLNIVDTTYRHYEKTVTSHGVFCPNNSRLKWYDVGRKDTSIPSSIHNHAKEFIVGQAAATGIPFENELGFTILHQCGDNFYFLMLCTWRNTNELWKTVYHFDTGNMQDFTVFPLEEPHTATFCVWEMAVVAQETLAWTKYLSSDRRPEDQDIYLLTS